MKPPTRLIDGGATELELRLLRAGARDEPPADALQRLSDSLGVRAAETASQAPAAAAGNATSLAAVSGKLALVVAAGLAIGGVAWLASQQPAEAPAPALAPASTSTTAPAAPPPPSAAEAPAAATAPSAGPSSGRALSEEIARLDAVRRLLAGRRMTPALEALERYEREYPRGALRQEATLLRIEALRRSGDRSGARALAERFLSDNPDSPHAARVRTLAFDGAHAR